MIETTAAGRAHEYCSHSRTAFLGFLTKAEEPHKRRLVRHLQPRPAPGDPGADRHMGVNIGL